MQQFRILLALLRSNICLPIQIRENAIVVFIKGKEIAQKRDKITQMRVLCIYAMFISLFTKVFENEPSMNHMETKRKHAVRRFRRTSYTEVLSWTCDGVQHLTVPFLVTPVA